MNSSSPDNPGTAAEEMDSLMLHTDIGNEFEESTEALLNSILRVEVVQLESDDEFAEELASSYGDSSLLYANTKPSSKTTLKLCSSFHSAGKEKQIRKGACELYSEVKEPCSNIQPIQPRERYFECNQCDRRFLQLSLLEIHKKEHNELQSFLVCKVCNESFSQPHDLHIHQEHCTHKTAYKCNMCIATFATRRRLSVHKRIHVNERPFPCDFCGACFLRKSSLSVHLRAKPLAQPFQKHLANLSCEGCKLAFISFCGKLKHYQVLHPESLIISENKYSADVAEESDPFPKVIVAYTEAGPDGEDQINYEFVSDSDAFSSYSCIEQKDPYKCLGNFQEGTSR